jgi:UDP-N-acetylglucosamine acyltransferase
MNSIHPTALIDRSVTLGDRNVIGPHVVISNNTIIGDDNWIGPGTTIGIEGDILGTPSSQDPPFWENPAQVEFGVRIGDRNVFKEHVTIHSGSHRHTKIGDSCYLMPRAHLGHDCWIGDNVLLSPGSQIAGHVSIGSRAVIGMGALVHQFSNIGPVAMVGMGCCVRGTVEPCRTVVGEPHRVSGINKVGIKRLLGEDSLAQAMAMLRGLDDLNPTTEPLRIMISDWLSQVIHNH